MGALRAAAGIFAETHTPVSFVTPAPGHRGGAYFSDAKRTSSKPIAERTNWHFAANQEPIYTCNDDRSQVFHWQIDTNQKIYTDDDVRRQVFDEENGPEKMRTLAQAEKDLWSFRDRDHVMEACLAGGRLHPEGLSDKEIREKCNEMKEMLPVAAEAFQAAMQSFHDDVDERYKIPTTRSTVESLVEECSKNAEMADAFSAAPGAGARYRDACADLKEALKKVDIAVQQNREGKYVARATV